MDFKSVFFEFSMKVINDLLSVVSIFSANRPAYCGWVSMLEASEVLSSRLIWAIGTTAGVLPEGDAQAEKEQRCYGEDTKNGHRVH